MMKTAFFRGAALCLFASLAMAAPDRSTVVLENGANKITVEDFDAAMTRFPEYLREAARAQPEINLKLIDSLFVNRVLAQKAAAAGLADDPLVQKRLEQLREAFLAQKYLDHVEANARIPNLEARAQELYKADPKRFSQPAGATVSHILVSYRRRSPQAARERALEARAKLAAGESLEKVAKEYSDYSNPALPPGELGFVRTTDVEPELARAIMSTRIGDWSEPIETRSGMHLVRVKDRKEARIPPFEEVKAAIIEEEADKLRKRAANEALSAVRNDPANTVYPDRVEALRSKVDPNSISRAHREAIEKIHGGSR